MSTAEPANPEPRKSRIVLWLLGLGVPLLLLLAWWPSGKAKARPALPNPNGYDYFVKAGEALAGPWTNQPLRAVPAHEWQTVLSANHASLELVREGLRHRSLSQVSVTYDSATRQRFIDQLGYLKRLGVLLAGEGRLAEMEARPTAAVESYLEAMCFGQESSRGGDMMERLVGISIEHIALAELRRTMLSLHAADARRGLAGLEKLDASHDLPEVNLAAEDEWIRETTSFGQRFTMWTQPTMRKEMRETRTKFAGRLDRLQVERRRAIVEAAARLFELEKGRRPTGYADLVPAYLPAAPLDPTSGKELPF